MSSKWIRSMKLSIINFTRYSKGNIILLKLVDASNQIKKYKYIFDLLSDVIKDVDPKQYSLNRYDQWFNIHEDREDVDE